MLNFDTSLEWEVVLKKSMFGSSYLGNLDFEVNVENTNLAEHYILKLLDSFEVFFYYWLKTINLIKEYDSL